MADTVKLSGSERPPRGESPPRATTGARAGGARTGRSARGGESSGASAAPPRQSLRGEDKKLRDALVGFYAQGGGVLTMAGMMRRDLAIATAGANIGAQAEAVADAWIDLAAQNPRIKQMLQGMVQGGAVAALIGVHVSMVIPVLSARGAVPPAVGYMMLHDDAKQFAEATAQQWNAEERAKQQQGGASE